MSGILLGVPSCSPCTTGVMVISQDSSKPFLVISKWSGATTDYLGFLFALWEDGRVIRLSSGTSFEGSCEEGRFSKENVQRVINEVAASSLQCPPPNDPGPVDFPFYTLRLRLRDGIHLRDEPIYLYGPHEVDDLVQTLFAMPIQSPQALEGNCFNLEYDEGWVE